MEVGSEAVENPRIVALIVSVREKEAKIKWVIRITPTEWMD